MSRNLISCLILVANCSLIAAAPPPERIAPANAVEMTIAPDPASLEAHFAKTQLDRIYADPAMQPFFNGAGAELFGLFELPDAIGIKWAAVKQISGGPIASISVPLPGQQLGTVVALDITGHATEAAAVWTNSLQACRRAGAAVHDRAFAGAAGIVLDLPDAAKKRRPVGVVMKDERLLIGDPPEALAPILAVADAKQSLAEAPAFKSIRSRTAMKAGETADLFWYFDPFGWDASTRPPVLTGKKKRVKDFGEILQQEGFDGVKGVGGNVSFSAGASELLVRLAVYAPQPHRSALRMLAFRPGNDLKPLPGLPGELAACIVTRINAMLAFESFAGIFDEIVGDGEKGTFKEVIDDLRDNPKGPRIDLRKDIVGQLGEVVTLISDCELPLTATSERAAVVFTVKDEKTVADAIRRAVEDDPKVKKTTVSGRTVWELVSDPPVQKPGEPPIPPDPNAAFCVADGKLYIATQASLVEKLFTRGGAGSLDSRSDYQRVCKEYERLGGASACIRLFARPEDDLRLTYDMWRKGQLDQATSIYAFGLNAIMPKNTSANTVWTLDGRKLPEYEKVSRHLGPVGVMLFVHPEGWDGTAFLLPRSP
jgi:hypothetical protein